MCFSAESARVAKDLPVSLEVDGVRWKSANPFTLETSKLPRAQ